MCVNIVVMALNSSNTKAPYTRRHSLTQVFVVVPVFGAPGHILCQDTDKYEKMMESQGIVLKGGRFAQCRA